MGGCCSSRASGKLETEVNKFINESQIKKITDEELANFYETHKSPVVTEEEFQAFSKKNGLNLSYKSLCKGTVMKRDEMILGIMISTGQETDKRIEIARKIMGNSQRKFMAMNEWRYQLLYKNLPEELLSKITTEEEKNEITNEINRFRFIAGRSAQSNFTLSHKSLAYRLIIIN